MPTMQIRHVPDDVHQTHRQRAAAAGMSLQEYLLAHLTADARRTSPAEVVAELRQRLASEGGDGFSPTSSAAAIAADRHRV